MYSAEKGKGCRYSEEEGAEDHQQAGIELSFYAYIWPGKV